MIYLVKYNSILHKSYKMYPPKTIQNLSIQTPKASQRHFASRPTNAI